MRPYDIKSENPDELNALVPSFSCCLTRFWPVSGLLACICGTRSSRADPDSDLIACALRVRSSNVAKRNICAVGLASGRPAP